MCAVGMLLHITGLPYSYVDRDARVSKYDEMTRKLKVAISRVIPHRREVRDIEDANDDPRTTVEQMAEAMRSQPNEAG